MALGDPYATLAELKGRLGITDTADDARLTAAIAAASRGIEDVTGRQFNDSGAVTPRLFRPADPRTANLDDFSTAAGLTVATDGDGDGVFETAWAAADWELAPLNGIRGGMPWVFEEIRAVGSRRFPRLRRAALQVGAQWGWAAVPNPIHETCLIIAAEVFKLKDAPFGVAGFSEFGAVRVRQNPIAMAMISPYGQVLA